jgi:hypothetical protein
VQPGIRFQLVKTEEEANLLPDNVIPLSFQNKKGALSSEDLQKVAGGVDPRGESPADLNIRYPGGKGPHYRPDE